MKGAGGGREPQLPTFTAHEQEGLRDYWAVYEKHYDQLNKVLLEKLQGHPELGPLIRAISASAMEQQNKESRERSRRAIMDGVWDDYWARLREDGARYAQGGLSFPSWFELITLVRVESTPLLVEAYAKDPKRLGTCLLAVDRMYDSALSIIGETYLSTKEEIINRQAVSIRELSTPVLQIREGRLIVPLIGVIDTRRAKEITEHLLDSIREHRAKVVIIDITGVPAVDSKVANHLIQTVEAARLMGAKAIVTGLSAEVAQTLVTLGIDLSRVRTLADLQSGIEEADHIQTTSYAKDV